MSGTPDIHKTLSTSVRLGRKLAVAAAVLCTVVVRVGIAGPPPATQPANIPGVPIGFSNLIVRLDSRDEIGLAGADFKVHMIEHLRERGFKAVGAESLVFNRDESQRAAVRIGGIVREIHCAKHGETLRCRLGVEWQVLDVNRDAVVYKAMSRSRAFDIPPAETTRPAVMLVLGALDSLLGRERFLGVLKAADSAPPPPDPTFSTATYQRCGAIGKRMPQAAEQVLDSTAVVKTSTGFGSGFFLTPDGLLLTAAHVLDGGKVTLRLRSGREIQATPIRVARHADVALLRPSERLTAPHCLIPAEREPPVGSELHAAGAPGTMNLAFSLTRGIVSGQRELDGRRVLQTDAPISPGNSGGPLVDPDGAATAIVGSKLSGGRVEGVAFGIPIAAALKTLGLVPGASTDASLLDAPAAAMEDSSQESAFVDVPDPVPSLDPEGDLRRRQSVLDGQRAQAARERDRAERAARDARERSRDRMTPAYLKVMRWGGLALGVAGAATVAVTYAKYDESQTTRAEFDTLRILNTAGWASLAIGGAGFSAYYALRPPLPSGAREQAPQPRSAWRLGPSGVSWEGSF